MTLSSGKKAVAVRLKGGTLEDVRTGSPYVDGLFQVPFPKVEGQPPRFCYVDNDGNGFGLEGPTPQEMEELRSMILADKPHDTSTDAIVEEEHGYGHAV